MLTIRNSSKSRCTSWKHLAMWPEGCTISLEKIGSNMFRDTLVHGTSSTSTCVTSLPIEIKAFSKIILYCVIINCTQTESKCCVAVTTPAYPEVSIRPNCPTQASCFSHKGPERNSKQIAGHLYTCANHKNHNAVNKELLQNSPEQSHSSCKTERPGQS